MRRPDQSHHVGTAREAADTKTIEAAWRDRRWKRKLHPASSFLAHLWDSEHDANVRYRDSR